METIFLYDDPSMGNLCIDELALFLQTHVPGVTVETRGDFWQHHLSSEGEGAMDTTSKEMARAKLPMDPEPLPMEVKFERRRIDEPSKLVRGVIYDGLTVMGIMWGLIPEDEAHRRALHIAFSSRLVGTKGSAGDRYHARVILCGCPTVISTVGMVEAPAKDRKYYLARSVEAAVGATPGITGDAKGDHLDIDDPRLTEVSKGYALQALFYQLRGDPFCDDPRCRLYNAHTQEALLGAQVGEPGVCVTCSNALMKMLN